MDPQSHSEQAPSNKKNIGPIIGIFVILIIIVVLVLYLFGGRTDRQQSPLNNSEIASESIPRDTQDVDTSATGTAQSSSEPTVVVQPLVNVSDDIQSLQDDLNNSTNGIDSQNF